MTRESVDGGRSVAVLVKGWPRLSETFIAQEVLELERLGVRQRLFALRQPTDGAIHALNRAVRAPVAYLPEYLHQQPVRVLRGVWKALRRAGAFAAARAWAADLARDFSRNRVRRFGQACVLAAELPADVAWLHVHFLHTPASVARYAALLTGVGWSFSAHAKDIWTTPEWDLREKLAEASWGVTCTKVGLERLRALARRPDKVQLVYHGLNFDRFGSATIDRAPRNGSIVSDPARLLSVGRAVEKKGFDVLLAALALLPPDIAWRWEHIGGGERLPALKAQAQALGLAGRVVWRGPQTQDAVIEACRQTDLFVFPARIAADGDRDGLPNVLMEAQALGAPCVASDVGGVAELIEDGVSGVLTHPDDPAALAAALARLIRDPALRNALATAGNRRVRSQFSCAAGVECLAARLSVGQVASDVPTAGQS